MKKNRILLSHSDIRKDLKIRTGKDKERERERKNDWEECDEYDHSEKSNNLSNSVSISVFYILV